MPITCRRHTRKVWVPGWPCKPRCARLHWRGDIGYINLHGTATPANDAAEGKAVAALFDRQVPCSSTKGATGHTLGAAGAVEAVICALALTEGFLPGSPGTTSLDPAIDIDYLLQTRPAQPTSARYALSNSFGFGGSNCSLIFGVAP